MGLFDKGRKTPTLTQMAVGTACYVVAPTVTLGVVGIATVIHYVRESRKETKEIESKELDEKITANIRERINSRKPNTSYRWKKKPVNY